MLIIGMVVALGVGYLLGIHSAPPQLQQIPANYDPSAAALKVSQDSTKQCYAMMLEMRAKEVAH